MNLARKGVKSYTQSYKKKAFSPDPYHLKGASPAISVCRDCRAVNKNKRWYASDADYEAAMKTPDTTMVVCPACLRIRDNFPGGIVTLKGAYVLPHKENLLNLIRNEEQRARGLNPLERVMSVQENDRGGMVISTTNEKMAQRIGRAVKKAFHGDVTYRWSQDTKLVRVEWVKE